MHIACPKCAVGFDLAESILGAKGRRLKCHSCGQFFFQSPDGRQVLLDAQAGPEKKPQAEPGSSAQSIMSKRSDPGNVKAAAIGGHYQDQAGAAAVGDKQVSLLHDQPKPDMTADAQSIRDQSPIAGPSGTAVSQLTGEKTAAAAKTATSMLSGGPR